MRGKEGEVGKRQDMSEHVGTDLVRYESEMKCGDQLHTRHIRYSKIVS